MSDGEWVYWQSTRPTAVDRWWYEQSDGYGYRLSVMRHGRKFVIVEDSFGELDGVEDAELLGEFPTLRAAKVAYLLRIRADQ